MPFVVCLIYESSASRTLPGWSNGNKDFSYKIHCDSLGGGPVLRDSRAKHGIWKNFD